MTLQYNQWNPSFASVACGVTLWKTYVLIHEVKEGKPGISCVCLNNSSKTTSVIYDVSIHKGFETNQVFKITWENPVSFILFPAIKDGIMEWIIYSFRGLHLFLFCSTNIVYALLYTSLDLVSVSRS